MDKDPNVDMHEDYFLDAMWEDRYDEWYWEDPEVRYDQSDADWDDPEDWED